MLSVAETLFKVVLLHCHLRKILFTDVMHALSCKWMPEVQSMPCNVCDLLGYHPSRHCYGSKDDNRCFGDGRHCRFMRWSSFLRGLFDRRTRSGLHLLSYTATYRFAEDGTQTSAASTSIQSVCRRHKKLYAGWSSHWAIVDQGLR